MDRSFQREAMAGKGKALTFLVKNVFLLYQPHLPGEETQE